MTGKPFLLVPVTLEDYPFPQEQLLQRPTKGQLLV